MPAVRTARRASERAGRDERDRPTVHAPRAGLPARLPRRWLVAYLALGWLGVALAILFVLAAVGIWILFR
jgi:hypothetical protein